MDKTTIKANFIRETSIEVSSIYFIRAIEFFSILRNIRTECFSYESDQLLLSLKNHLFEKSIHHLNVKLIMDRKP